MYNSKPVDTPFGKGLTLSFKCLKTDDEMEAMNNVPYTSAVGSLM